MLFSGLLSVAEVPVLHTYVYLSTWLWHSWLHVFYFPAIFFLHQNPNIQLPPLQWCCVMCHFGASFLWKFLCKESTRKYYHRGYIMFSNNGLHWPCSKCTNPFIFYCKLEIQFKSYLKPLMLYSRAKEI